MKVSIITATYNSGLTIETCIKSILNQCYLIHELIIVDGKSTDNTIPILKKLTINFNRIKIISEKDNGVYDALNKGVEIASGDVIGFVHSDDFLASSSVISEITKKIRNESLDGVFGDLHYVRKEKTGSVFRKWIGSDFDFDLLKKGWMPAHPTFFLKKTVYKKHGSFDLNFSISADYDFMIRVLSDKSLKFGYIKKVITIMRVGGVSNRNLKNIFNKSKEDYRIIKKNNVGGLLTLFLKNFYKLSQFVN
tara:strand:- start:4426 stop:5175 length:750 start_codon:yes stop_codon:yes gene_type:complete